MANILFPTPNAGQPYSGGMTQQANQNLYHVKNIMQMLRTAKNPESVLQQIAQQNPAIQQVMEMCKGKDPQQIFMEACKQKGIDPMQVISMLK